MPKIKKPWCVYVFGFIPGAVGKIESASKNSAYVRYCEGQMYPVEVWDRGYLIEFKNITGAIKKFAELEGITLMDACERALRDFPSERKAIETMMKKIRRG